MRMAGRLFGVLVVAAVAALPCAGSIFGKEKLPVPQWGLDAVRTKTPDYAKDSPSVVLFDEYLETVDTQGHAIEREREAIRILKPQGRSRTCGVAHDVDEKINYFRVWTIAADEKQYAGQEDNFTEVGDVGVPTMLSTYQYRMAHPTAVDVDAVIICESEVQLKPYVQETSWTIQHDNPIIYEALEVDLPPGRNHSEAWHRYDAVKPVEVAPNHWRWEIRAVPALSLRDIPSHPDWGALAPRLSVQWGDAAIEGRENQWKALGEFFTGLEENRPDPSPEIVAKVHELLPGNADFFTKLSKISESIQKDIRYFVISRGKSGLQANHAADIFRNRYGDCKDKATLLISMLQVVGIHANYVAVDHRRGYVDPNQPSIMGDHMIAAIEIPAGIEDARLKAVAKAKDGKRYLIFDPTDENTPIGNLPSNEQGGYGLLAAGAASQVLELPILAPEANSTERKGAFTLATDGTLSGAVETAHLGPDGSDLRWFLRNSEEKERRERWEREIGRQVPGVVLDSFQFVQPAALDKPLEFHYKLTAHQYAHTAGPLLLVRPRVVGTDTLPNDDKPRTVPINLEATGHWHDSYDITLPEGYVVDDVPDKVDMDMDFASYHSAVTTKDRVLHYERDFKMKKVELPAERQADFKHLEGMILADEKATVVLKKQS